MNIKSCFVHAKNKYPKELGYDVSSDLENFLIVKKDGEILHNIVRDGMGNTKDLAEEIGCKKFDMSPIPRDARHLKIDKAGHIMPDEEAGKRKPRGIEYAKKHGYVPSVEELDKLSK